MEQQGALIERSLREFGPTLLGCYEQDGQLFWESGELFSFLINGVWRKVRFPTGPAYQTLPDAHLTFGGGMLEIRQGERRRYASMLSIKEFAGQVEPGTLGALLYEDSEFIETQSFSSLPRREAMAALTTAARPAARVSDDVVASQIAEPWTWRSTNSATASSVMGEYHYRLVVFGDSSTMRTTRGAGGRRRRRSHQPADGAGGPGGRCRLVLADARAIGSGGRARPASAAAPSRRWPAATTSLRGKRDGNPWGEALALMRTPAGNPFYLNLHASPEGEDCEDKKLPGNTIVIGSTGSARPRC